jgi:hypothetical protein
MAVAQPPVAPGGVAALPPVMSPLLSPMAAWFSLIATLAGVVAVSAPAVQKILEPNTSLSERIVAIAGMIVSAAGALHLSVSRSTISSVDNPPKGA